MRNFRISTLACSDADKESSTVENLFPSGFAQGVLVEGRE
jgi:hypothetical protein